MCKQASGSGSLAGMLWLGEAFAAVRHLRPSFVAGLVAAFVLVLSLAATCADEPGSAIVEVTQGR